MDSMKLPKAGGTGSISGGSTPAQTTVGMKSSTNAGSSSNSSPGVPISVHFNASEESVDDLFPQKNLQTAAAQERESASCLDGNGVVLTPNPTTPTTNSGSTFGLASELNAQQNSVSPSHQTAQLQQQQHHHQQNTQTNLDEQSRNFLHGNFFNRKSGGGGGVGVGGGGNSSNGGNGNVGGGNASTNNSNGAGGSSNNIYMNNNNNHPQLLDNVGLGGGQSPLPAASSPVIGLNELTDGGGGGGGPQTVAYNGGGLQQASSPSASLLQVSGAGSNGGGGVGIGCVGLGGLGGSGVNLSVNVGGVGIGGNSGGVSPNSISPHKYQRSMSYPNKSATGSGCGSSPVPCYKLDIKAAQAAMHTLSMGNGASGGGGSVTPTAVDSAYVNAQGNGGGSVSAGASTYGNGVINMSPIEHCINDIVRNMSQVVVAGGSGAGAVGGVGTGDPGGNNVNAAAIAERLRCRKTMNARENEMAVGGVNMMGVPGQQQHDGNSPMHVIQQQQQPPHGQPGSAEHMARYSRKVFVGGLPPDIDEDEITVSFRRFGPLVVDWPHKAESKSYFPPKGYAFLLFQDENSVQQLIDSCIIDDDKLYLCVSSPTIKDKPVQIRPWRLADADYVLDATMSLDPRKTVFVGGVPRPLKAFELAMIMNRLYGGVCYAGIDTDPELKYPKGAGRVAFANQQSYIAAISARFVQLQHGDIDKRVEVKPYVLDDQMCDECEGQRCGGKFAPFFCANVTCLQYYCEHCWAGIHSRPGREYHKPLVKEGADRPRAVPFRWC